MYPGIYRLDAFAIRGTNVFTNRAPVGAYRGAGRPEATYAIERMVDELAAELGLDPVDLRRRSWATDFPHTNAGGVTYDVGDYDAATDRALELLDYAALRDEQRAPARGRNTVQLGIGVSTYTEACGGGYQYLRAPPRRPPRCGCCRRLAPRSPSGPHPSGRATPRRGASWSRMSWTCRSPMYASPWRHGQRAAGLRQLRLTIADRRRGGDACGRARTRRKAIGWPRRCWRLTPAISSSSTVVFRVKGTRPRG